ncbi:MAG: hypothetical protein ACREBR_04625 [bacterium]
MITLKIIGFIFVFISVFFDLYAYWKQVDKTLREKESKDVSTSFYIMKITHYICSIIALTIFANYAGLIIEAAPLIFCLITLVIVARFKPKGWTLFGKSSGTVNK